VANDQAADLVDTELFKQTGSEVEEVAGGCFCCRFPDMIAAMERLVRDTDADVLIGEPVGSCTDLSATVLQPLKKLHGRQFDLAPFSVLVDGHQVRVLNRLRRAAEQDRSARFPDNVLYIYEKQLEEADLIVLNKCDLLSPTELADLQASLAERFPDTPLLAMSALTGDGVDAWLELLDQDRRAGRKIAAVDYDTYAAGEAALGWLNAVAQLHADLPAPWGLFVKELLEGICSDLRAATAEIAHLKLYLTAGSEHVGGNLTANDATIFLRGSIQPACQDARLLINARVHCHPDQLRGVVEARLLAAAGAHRIQATITHMRSLMPGRPQPTHRYESPVRWDGSCTASP
jgi:Ni2+-binding GTPase involved in maturation of urease and hydrogenase